MSERKITKEELLSAGTIITSNQVQTGEVTSQVCLTCEKLKKENTRLLGIIQSITRLLKELKDE